MTARSSSTVPLPFIIILLGSRIVLDCADSIRRIPSRSRVSSPAPRYIKSSTTYGRPNGSFTAQLRGAIQLPPAPTTSATSTSCPTSPAASTAPYATSASLCVRDAQLKLSAACVRLVTIHAQFPRTRHKRLALSRCRLDGPLGYAVGLSSCTNSHGTPCRAASGAQRLLGELLDEADGQC